MTRLPPTTRLSLLAALPLLAAAGPAPLHRFDAIAISPDGATIASIESDDVAHDGEGPAETLHLRARSGSDHTVALACPHAPCRLSSPAWSRDGRLAVLVDQGSRTAIETIGPDHAVRTLLTFDGPLDTLKFAPDGRLAVLATANAHKRVGATAAAARMTGEIGTVIDEQRIAVVDAGALHFVSPPDLYVYEYDWRPDGKGFVGTAATGNGDSDWWIAKLFAFDPSGAHVLFAPPGREQLADPVVSPDGRTVAFIGGWMSDFGSTGGDAYEIDLNHPAVPADVAPDAHATVTDLDWQCGGGLTTVSLAGAQTRVDMVGAGPARPLWSGPVSIGSGGWNLGLACDNGHSAVIRESFTEPPELAAGPIGQWTALTHANAAQTKPADAISVEWTDDNLHLQGWLLRPPGGGGKRAMITDVHGGPQAASVPEFPGRGLVRDLLAAGYDVFMPNYRGSFGQGEAFATAEIGDIGGGDWRDVMTGVTAAEHAAPIDESRLGISGASYGGYMAMWAVSQTHRFKAAAADAGVSDWLSIEGEAPQAGSDAITFGGSVYDNAAPYLRASPVMHIKGATTPTLITVGERDVECPMPQSQEFATALEALGVPSSFVVYAGEGHAIVKEADRADLRRRTLAWFAKYLSPQAGRDVVR